MALTNSQYDALMHQYELRRRQGRLVAQQHLEEVYRRIPEYRALDDQIPTISAAFGQRMIEGKETSVDGLSVQLDAIRARKQELLRQAGLPVDYTEPQYTCPICRDTGYVNNKRCQCFERQIIDLLYQDSNLAISSALYANFEDLKEDFYREGEERDQFRRAREQAVRFVQDFTTKHPNLLLYGTAGSGKSTLSVCIARKLLDKRHSVLYFSATDLFSRLGDVAFSYDSDDREQRAELKERLTQSELLIIDDLGTETDTKLSRSQLFDIINGRLYQGKSTIISSNLGLEQIRDTYSDRIFSRIISSYTACHLTCSDIRIAGIARRNNG